MNRGWFSAVCAALRDDTSYPDQAAPLFWCPGRQPEQADIVAPRYDQYAKVKDQKSFSFNIYLDCPLAQIYSN